MPSTFNRLAGAVAASLCLFAAPAIAAVPLKWAPPVLTSPIVVNIPATTGAFQADCHGRDCVLVWPRVKHVGSVQIFNSRNLVSIGGWNTVPPARYANGQLNLSNTAPSRILEVSTPYAGVIHVEGLLGDASAGGMSDGIDITAPASTVQIENVRIDGIYGYYNEFHADCIQPFGGVKALRVYNFTCNTGYQGLSIWPVATSPAGWTADIERTNITSVGPQIWGAHNSGGYVYWPCADTVCTNAALTSLNQVYLQARPVNPFSKTVYSPKMVEAAGAPASISFPGLSIIGKVSQGVPPGGDFVPAGYAGVNYISPGYAQ